ncbi:hypothetical protein [Bdellovibrio sp. HCB288]|uniref:hypothetical protein n=1 Tax=Bdellovibrio sp. HCB288 TaxID=3394355 RepID=UPI0039B62084
MKKIYLVSFIALLFASIAHSDESLKELPKTYFCEKVAGVGILPAGIESLNVKPPKDEAKLSQETKLRKLIQADMPLALLAKHKELCQDGRVKTSSDYMSKLDSTCHKYCKSYADCLNKCASISDNQLLFLEGVSAGKQNCYAKSSTKTAPKTGGIQ